MPFERKDRIMVASGRGYLKRQSPTISRLMGGGHWWRGSWKAQGKREICCFMRKEEGMKLMEAEGVPTRASGRLLTRGATCIYVTAQDYNFPIWGKPCSFITLDGTKRCLQCTSIHPFYMKSIFRVRNTVFNHTINTNHDDHFLPSLCALITPCNPIYWLDICGLVNFING